jgi:hypothetical protein
MTILLPTFFGQKFGPTKFRKGSTPDLEKLDPIFQNELFFLFSVTPKSMFSWSILPDEHGKMVYFFYGISLSYYYDGGFRGV